MSKELAKNEIYQRVAENEALIALGAKQNFESMLNIAMGLKGIVDLANEVSWKTLGYKDFEDYTVTRWNVGKVQAYKYLAVAERLPKHFVHSVNKSAKASISRLLALLPNDQNEFKLTPDQIEELMDLPSEEFKEELVKITGYDRKRDGGRGPSDLDRPSISRDRYRDQQKKIRTLEAQKDTLLDEKDELVGELEKKEKLVEELKKSASPDQEKDDLIQRNKTLTLENDELKRLVVVDRMINATGDAGIRVAIRAIAECAAVFNRMAQIELGSHQQYAEFRVYTDCIRRLLDQCEDRVGVTMCSKGLNPKGWHEWHNGDFKYHLDKETEQMRRDFAEKEEKRIDDLIDKDRAERKQRKLEKEGKAKKE